MAGSYNHVVKKDGSLQKPERVCSMLECMSGDVYEAVEEMYGMIWYLADRLALNSYMTDTAEWVETARLNYKLGLALSPTKRFPKEQENG